MPGAEQVDAPSLARRIEHTLLRAEATRADIERTLEEAVAWGCHGICVQPFWVPLLRDAPLPVITVAGFPFGAEPKMQKASAAAWAVEAGADEIDMVLNIGALKSGDLHEVAEDVAVVRAATPDKVLKVILETGLLESTELETAAQICVDSGADFLKTCTGYGPRGATVADVVVLRRFGRVKASAGIRTRADAIALVEAGADRLGTSAAATILGIDA